MGADCSGFARSSYYSFDESLSDLDYVFYDDMDYPSDDAPTSIQTPMNWHIKVAIGESSLLYKLDENGDFIFFELPDNDVSHGYLSKFEY